MNAPNKRKRYTGDTSDFEKKLARVMERLKVEKYSYDWQQNRSESTCYVEMCYSGRAYRFENSTEKSAQCGRNLKYVSDLFAAVVYALEGLARAVEQGIFTLDMLLAGVPALPAATTLEPCFVELGFDERPENEDQVKQQYRQKAKSMHPDGGGDGEMFERLTQAYNACMTAMKKQNQP